MKELKKVAKKMASAINDPIERKEAVNEIYQHLLESYEEFREESYTHKEALKMSIEHFGESKEMEDELKQAHIKPLNRKSWLIILSTSFIFLIVLYLLLFFVFA